jgi:hypothetical protein
LVFEDEAKSFKSAELSLPKCEALKVKMSAYRRGTKFGHKESRMVGFFELRHTVAHLLIASLDKENRKTQKAQRLHEIDNILRKNICISKPWNPTIVSS